MAPGIVLDGLAPFAAVHGFGAISFHTLRHGRATLLLADGVSDAVAIKLMRHADTKILRPIPGVDELQRDAAMQRIACSAGECHPSVTRRGF
jgi:integrase